MEEAGRPYATAASVTRLGVVSVLSALSGLAMEMTLAWRFGASATVDAFRVSVLLLLLAQQIFVHIVWPNVLVPLIAEYEAQGRGREAWQVGLALGNLLVTAAGVLSLVVFFWPEPFAHVLGPGLTGDARTTGVFLVRWFGLTFVPIVLIGLAASFLYARGVFSVRAWVQVLSNMAIAAMVVMLGRSLGPSSLVAGVMLGSIASSVVCVQMVRRLMRDAGVQFQFTIRADYGGLGNALRLAIPLCGSVAAGFWASVVINRLLSEMPVSTLATFGYAWRMCQLVSMGPSLVGAVLFPRFAESRYAASKEEFSALCTGALRMGAFIAIPMACIGFFLRAPLVALLFQRGEFSAETAGRAAWLFGLLLLGVPASVAVDYVQKMLYATQRMWMPTGVQLVGAVLLTVVARAVADRFGADGLAMACVLLVWLSYGSLASIFNRRDRAIRLGEVGVFTVKVLSVAIASAWLGSEVGRACANVVGLGGVAPVVVVGIGGCVGAVIFLGATSLLRLPEALLGWRYLRWQGGAIVGRVQDALRG